MTLRLSRRNSLKTLAAAAALQTGMIAAPRGAAAAANKPKIRLIVLDMGGTIIEDHGEVPDSMKAALAKGGITVSLAEIGDWRGASKRQMVRHFVELRTKPNADRERLIESVYRDFSARANKAYADVKPITGAEDAFRALRAKGFLLATTTGFDRNLTDLIFDRLGWKGHFAATVASDEVADGRPSPYMLFHAMEAARVERVAETIAVGDTPLDLQAGSNAGLAGVIGVLSGAGTAERLQREPHTHIIPSVAQLPALLDEAF